MSLVRVNVAHKKLSSWEAYATAFDHVRQERMHKRRLQLDVNSSDGATGSTSGHRLFVGLCIDLKSTASIRQWAESAYAGQPVRLVEEGQMHATVAFFPSVTDEKRQWIAEMVRSIQWDPLEALTCETYKLGRGALALGFELSENVELHLNRRLLRATNFDNYESALYDRLRSEPLGRLMLAQGEPELVRLYRDQRHGPMPFHVTFARYKDKASESIPLLPMSPLAIQLTRVALFESHLGPAGSTYEVIAESPKA
jgi:2'-5' RNA ligase